MTGDGPEEKDVLSRSPSRLLPSVSCPDMWGYLAQTEQSKGSAERT